MATLTYFYVRGARAMRRDSLMPEQGANVVFNSDGFAYWRNENGFFKAPIVGTDTVNFKGIKVVDPMTEPTEDLHMLLEIMSRLE